MAWRLKRVEEQRKFLIEQHESGQSIASICRELDISRKTAYKWLHRHQEQGNDGLIDLPKAPKAPFRLYKDSLIDLAVKLKCDRPHWGPKKIIAYLERKFPESRFPSQSRMYEIFKELHLTKLRRVRRRVPATSPLGELAGCNDTWIADFKGWFYTQNKEKCEPFTMSDAHSRFLIKCIHMSKKDTHHVWHIFKEAFEEYGLPKRIRTDNGPPFGSKGAGRLTMLSVNLIKAGVQPEWINPGHPEENGRHERFHLSLKEAVASPPASTLKEQIRIMDDYIEEYNFERPHEALMMKTPSDCYCESERKWDGKLRSPEYDSGRFAVRKVGQSGSLWLNGKEIYISSALVGEYVGIKESEVGREIYYGPICLGIVTGQGDLKEPKLKRKAIIRRG